MEASEAPSKEFLSDIVDEIIEGTAHTITAILNESPDAFFDTVSLFGLHCLARDHSQFMTYEQKRICLIYGDFLRSALVYARERREQREDRKSG